jgi:hypothetical protein
MPWPAQVFVQGIEGLQMSVSETYRQLKTTIWAVCARADHSATVTFPLAVKSTQLHFLFWIGEKL